MAKAPATEVEVGGRRVRISNPDRVYFPASGATKLDLPLQTLVRLEVPTWDPESCPLCAKGEAIVKPGSRV